VSRAFVAKTSENLDALPSRSLADVRLAVLMIDGIDLKGPTNVVALGIGTDGFKTPWGAARSLPRGRRKTALFVRRPPHHTHAAT
jgi:hypothetical protein